MKRIVSIGIAMLLLCCVSCKKFLTTEPTDIYIEGDYWTSSGNALGAVNACYAVLMDGALYRQANLRIFNYSPNSFSPSADVQVETGIQNADNFDLALTRWNADYKGIGRVNAVLFHVGLVKMDASLKHRIKGEAYFLRGLFYADLVNFYGGIPLILDAPNLDKQAHLPRNTKEEVIKQVLIDLDSASILLPVSYSGADIGRATKGAALGLKARVLLYEGKWSEAASAAKAVMDLNRYKLFPDYRGLFLLANESNQEVIFDVQFKIPDYPNTNDIYLDRQINMAPTLDLVHSYYMLDGLPITESPLYNSAKPYENRDPRLQKTVVIPGYEWRGQIAKESKYFSTGFGFKKYTSYTDDVKTPDNSTSEINFIILRYADILLMYAEAENEAVGPDPSVYAAINQVRGRVGMPDIPLNLSQDSMRQIIRHERRVELAGEGLYYNDIRRWGTAEQVMSANILNINGEIIQKRSFTAPKDNLWPIASITLEENPALVQNPGY